MGHSDDARRLGICGSFTSIGGCRSTSTWVRCTSTFTRGPCSSCGSPSAILVIGGIAVLASRKRELIQKWTTWVLIAPIVGIPVWIGRGPTAALAAAAGGGRGGRVRAVGEAEQRSTPCHTWRCERPVPIGGMAAPITVGSRADRRIGLCAAVGCSAVTSNMASGAPAFTGVRFGVGSAGRWPTW